MKTYVLATFIALFIIFTDASFFPPCHKESQKPLKLQRQQHTIAVV